MDRDEHTLLCERADACIAELQMYGEKRDQDAVIDYYAMAWLRHEGDGNYFRQFVAERRKSTRNEAAR